MTKSTKPEETSSAPAELREARIQRESAAASSSTDQSVPVKAPYTVARLTPRALAMCLLSHR
jgi:hypothetical protein